MRKENFSLDSNESLVLLSEPSIVQQHDYSDRPSDLDLSDIHKLNKLTPPKLRIKNLDQIIASM